ncbi:TPA: hypothetical protein ACP0O4_001668 [Streptococcus pyogenes]
MDTNDVEFQKQAFINEDIELNYPIFETKNNLSYLSEIEDKKINYQLIAYQIIGYYSFNNKILPKYVPLFKKIR